RAGSLLIDVNIVVPDYLAPARELALEHRARGFDGTLIFRERVEALDRPALDQRGIGHDFLQRGVKFVDHRLRRPAWREQALPIDDVELRPEHRHDAVG